MALLLSDIHLPALITSTLSEHTQYKSLPWNNLDQLSCLWGVFTKCKKNIRDGFRLENLSWRLWYRQSVLQKKAEPKTSKDIKFSDDNSNDSFGHPLRRTRSLPDLSQWSQQKNGVMTKGTRSGTLTPARRHSKPVKPKQKFFITPITAAEHVEEPVEEILTFTKKSKTSQKLAKITTSPLKPVSLLSSLLQQQEMMKDNDNGMGGGGLRRCQSRYCRLDQFFLNANNTASPTA